MSSGLMNISGTAVNNDPSFRYKMPRLTAKIEGRGNGIKTVVTNMAEISDALNRPASLPTKFFGTELGAQSRWEADVNKATVNGAHTQPDLQRLLNVFVDKFVLCPGCHLPETALVVKKGIISHKCAACGSRIAVDMSHKLCVFILKEAATAAAALKEEAAKEKAEKKEKVRAAAAAAAAARASSARACAAARAHARAPPPSPHSPPRRRRRRRRRSRRRRRRLPRRRRRRAARAAAPRRPRTTRTRTTATTRAARRRRAARWRRRPRQRQQRRRRRRPAARRQRTRMTPT